MQLHRLLDENITVLTASRRLAHALQLEYAQHAQSLGLTAWRTPRVLPWSAWLRRQWLETRASAAGGSDLRLLTPAQVRVIWEDIVEASEWSDDLLSPASAARAAARSWQRLNDYLIPLEQIKATLSPETQALCAWAQEFVRRCEAIHAIDEARLSHWAHDIGLLPQEPVMLAGFDSMSPALQRLIERWHAHGQVIAPPESADASPDIAVVSAPDSDAELDLVARWARAQVESGCRRVGVVLSDLQTRRAAVQRTFEDVFAPGLRDTQAQPAALPVVIAAPRPLSTYPIVEAAALILQLVNGNCASTVAGRVLRSPFIAGSDAESDRRAQADFRLRDEQRDKWDWFELERWAAITDCERLQLAAREVGGIIRAETAPASASRWVERFHRLLRAAGWPGGRTLDSVEHQTVLKLQATLAEFGTLDAVLKNMPARVAIARLRDLLHDTPFEPQTQAAAVTVIDPTTVSGMQFDALWVAGLDATHLPGPINPDPLLPLELQRAAGIPDASAEGVLEQARLRLQRWTSSAPRVILSWPEKEGEAQLQGSPLLEHWPRLRSDRIGAATVVRSLGQTLFLGRPALLEDRDDHAPAVYSHAARGGAMTLELQSRCPFRAQAQLRLHAPPVPRVSVGVEPIDRGVILHRVLAEIWESLRSQQALMALPEQELEQRVRACTERQVTRALQPADRYRGRLATLEVDSVVRQVMQLLALEKQRPAFTVRFAEMAEPYVIGGLAITLQPDRIDELSSGGQLLIDYKLGDSHAPRQWLDTWPGRPRRPQLPLYGLAHSHTLAALAFVVLATGAVEYRGWSNGAAVGAGVLPYPSGIRRRPGDPMDWEALLQHWQETLAQLARQFVAGAAQVDPLPQECATCHLSTFCRIHERAAAGMEAGDE